MLIITLGAVGMMGGRIADTVSTAGGNHAASQFAFMVPPVQVAPALAAQQLQLGTAPGGVAPSAPTETAAAGDTLVAAPAEEPIYVTHQVSEGESLGSIAETHGVGLDYMIWNNPEVGADPNMLIVGEELLVPAEPGIVYDVKLGDTVTDIAAAFSVDPAAIVSYAPNRLESADMIVEGATLLLPGAVPPAPPPPPVIEETVAPVAEEPVAAPAFVPARAPAAPAPAPVASAGFIWPANGRLNSGFGPRWGSFHNGIDIGAPAGAGVAAAASGQVVLAKWGTGYGYYVVVRHDNGMETLYAHLSAMYVGMGQYVGQGETIGAVGCTGWCTGNHLHFEVHVGGVPVNPVLYLP